MRSKDICKIKESVVTPEMLHEIFCLSDDFKILWKNPPSNRVKVGFEAGWTNSQGYRMVSAFGVELRGHRVVFAMVNGRWPNDLLDHKDGNKLNNNPENLRECSDSENVRNMAKPSHNTSGFKGVGFCKQTGRYTAWIWKDNKKIWLGRHETIEQARRAYMDASKIYHGDFGCDGER